MIARNLCLLLAMTISTVAFGESRKISTCFEEGLAALRLNQLEDGIDHCHQVIEDKAAPLDRRGQAYAQRGLMQARRWGFYPQRLLRSKASPILLRRYGCIPPRLRGNTTFCSSGRDSTSPWVRPSVPRTI
jgi:hypothetical protein